MKKNPPENENFCQDIQRILKYLEICGHISILYTLVVGGPKASFFNSYYTEV